MSDTHIKINAVTPRVQYTGNGVTTTFPYEFAIFDETDMVVYVDNDIIESGYTVTGAGETEGGTVVFDTAPADGKKITLLRNVPIERVTDFQEGGTFRPKNLNDEFDRQTAFVQQVQEKLDRAVVVGPTSDVEPEAVLSQVETLYNDIDNIDAVAADLTNIDAVASNQTNIDAVAGNETNINVVAGNETNINTVAGISSNVTAVAGNATNINTCASNIDAITGAPTSATNAANSALAAAASASAAAISAAGTHFKLFQHGWFDYELNDLAWLRADTFSWQDGTVYSDAYNHLVDDVTNGTSQTETISGHTITYTLASDGHKIVQSADASAVEGLYNDTGVAWYYILDLVNHKFKLPRENPNREELIQTVRAKGTGEPHYFNAWNGVDYSSLLPLWGRRNSDNVLYTVGDNNAGNANHPMTLSTDSTKSGIISDMADSTSVFKGRKYLYFYVGQFTQSATEQTAGLNSELFNGKMDLDLGNVTITSKRTIAGFGMPNYSGKTSYTPNSAVPSNGFVFIAAYGYDSFPSISVNGVAIIATGPGNYNCTTSSVIPVYAGDKVTHTGTLESAYFVPCIGG